MAFLFSSVNYSIQHMNDKTSEWFTFPKYDAIVYVSSVEEAKEFLDSSEDVEKYVFTNIGIYLSGIHENSGLASDRVNLEIYNDCSKEMLDLPLIKGRHPKAQDEIMMSYNLAKECGAKVGEWFHLETDHYAGDYLICGLFSSMFNNGRNIIINGEEAKKFSSLFDYDSVDIFFKEGVDYKAFEAAEQKALPFSNISQTPPFMEGSLKSTNSISKPLTSMFVVIFALFSLLNIINILIMNNIENRRQFGILKAMGFSDNYICGKNLLKIMLLTVVSMGLAVLIHVTLSQTFFFGIIHLKGLIPNPSMVASVAGAIILAVIAITLLFTIPMRRVAPTELMEE